MPRLDSRQVLAFIPSEFAFAVIQTDAGTSPTADSNSDTLTLTSSDGSVTITGTASTDTVNFVATGTNIGGFTAGSVIFAGATGKLSQDNTNLFWDATNHRFSIGGHSTTSCLAVMSLSTTDITCSLFISSGQTVNVLEIRDNQLAVIRAFIDYGGNIGAQRQIAANHSITAGNGADTNINGNLEIIACSSSDQSGMGAFSVGQKGIYFFTQVSGNLYSICNCYATTHHDWTRRKQHIHERIWCWKDRHWF